MAFPEVGVCKKREAVITATASLFFIREVTEWKNGRGRTIKRC